ncbi:Methyltransferase domain-containing protein [Roseovarius nanhaiticus]|uniref:Methyltransferase domain-containing protein n=1 Tax=Roseovarius nanhaiticus TaxID=573024 RepID=A0A1N7G1H5_9RHOB|nr:class I SAM-dependent methyltransferase [Roseovarius nanhaiticus]SEK39755.1 Methyltransferase domain-containing protein [Roseovarius nanhaiticus]SIS06417.1 Methyltransferase domain-containing protein [Roseovarius nanhaiticus]
MGFSADWLALREPADHAARDAGLLRQAAVAAGPAPVILDLGCGTGSTVRALAPHLPRSTLWRLVDNDPDLLDRAAKAARDGGARAETHACNLADLDSLPLEGVTLVTASALLDLMPEAWLRAFAARLGVPFYAALSYDGRMEWQPEEARDAPVTEAFNRHQRGDKGIGPALGPDAAPTAAAVFAEAGFDVIRARSDWQLGPEQAPLQAELVRGIAAAA